MAQTKNKRKRKHRGTPAGTVERRTGSSRVKKDAKQISRERRQERMNREPTWRGSLNRAAIAAVVFAVVAMLLLDQPPAGAAALAAFAFLLYVPSGYYMDKFIYQRRQRQKQTRGQR